MRLWDETCATMFDKNKKMTRKQRLMNSRISRIDLKARNMVIYGYYHQCKLSYKFLLKKWLAERNKILPSINETTNKIDKININKIKNCRFSLKSQIKPKSPTDCHIVTRKMSTPNYKPKVSVPKKPIFNYMPSKSELVRTILKVADNQQTFG